MKKKEAVRNGILSKYISFLRDKVIPMGKAKAVKFNFLKYERLLLLNNYIRNISMDIYLDSIQLQACLYSSSLKNIVKMIPSEYTKGLIQVNNGNFKNAKINENNVPCYPNSSFKYFDDHQGFEKLYVPSWYEILQLKDRSNEDIDFLFDENGLLISDDVLMHSWQNQLNTLFFKDPTPCNMIINHRNKFFKEAFSYSSSSLLFLQVCSFFINYFNLKFVDICLTQKPNEIYDVIIIGSGPAGFFKFGEKARPLFSKHI